MQFTLHRIRRNYESTIESKTKEPIAKESQVGLYFGNKRIGDKRITRSRISKTVKTRTNNNYQVTYGKEISLERDSEAEISRGRNRIRMTQYRETDAALPLISCCCCCCCVFDERIQRSLHQCFCTRSSI